MQISHESHRSRLNRDIAETRGGGEREREIGNSRCLLAGSESSGRAQRRRRPWSGGGCDERDEGEERKRKRRRRTRRRLFSLVGEMWPFDSPCPNPSIYIIKNHTIEGDMLTSRWYNVVVTNSSPLMNIFFFFIFGLIALLVPIFCSICILSPSQKLKILLLIFH